MPGLTSMKNIGKEMSKKLTAVGIDTPEKLQALGAKEAFRKLKEAFPNICLVHLYTLEGAVRNTEFHNLPEAVKKELKKFSDSFGQQKKPGTYSKDGISICKNME